MTFFYDINKRLAEIDQNKKSIKQLNESSKLNEKMYFDPATGQTTDRTFNTAMQNRQFTADVDRAKSSLYMKPNDSNVYSKERGLGPGMAADRLQQRGVDLPGLVGNRPNPAALDAGLEEDEKLKEMMRLSGLSEDDMEEGNEFSGALDAARDAGEKTFDVDGQTYPVKEGVAEGSEEGNLYSTALQRYPQLKKVDRETVINALNDAYEDYLMHYGYEGIGPDEESSMIDHAVKGLKQGVAEGYQEREIDNMEDRAAIAADHIIEYDKRKETYEFDPDNGNPEFKKLVASKLRQRGFNRLANEILNSIDDESGDYTDSSMRRGEMGIRGGVAEGSLKEGQYEMMMRNGQVKKFIAKDDADAKRIAAGHGAKSVIRLKGGVPAGKVSEQGVAEGKARKPDFPDIDKDGNTTEPISQAAKDAAKRKIAGKRYGGAAQQDDRDDQEPSRGPGRPEEGGPKHTYDAPFGRVNIPAWKGPRTVHKIGDAEPGKAAPRRGRPKKIGEQQDDMIDIVDRGEYDREGDMAHDQLRTILDAAEELRSILTADENLPEWVQSKITKALDYIDTARDYMKSQKSGETEPVTEKAVSVAQRRAAGIAHAAQKGEIPKEELRGASKEMVKMPKGELKKFAKTKETGLPEKVKETTTSGSVATSDVETKPKKSKGGVSFGKGIYDSWNRELEVMIAESMDITVNQHTQDDGSIKKTITVNATDEDAEQLAQLLNLAGMDQHDDMHDDHMCPVCHQDPCECAEIVDENSPDWPTSTEYNDDPLQYSGGLNRPKSTGQTTVPVIASQFSRQMSESDQSAVDELDRIRLLLGK